MNKSRKTPRKRNNKPQMVYFITDGINTKIGVSKSPRKRISTLQVGNPKKLRFIYLFRLGAKFEKRFYREFEKYKTEANNEWFKFESKVWLHNKLVSLQKKGWKIDVRQASHLGKLITGSREDALEKQRDNIEKKKPHIKKSPTIAGLIIKDVKRMLLKPNNVIYYDGLVKKYSVSKDNISFYIKGAKLAHKVWEHNRKIKNQK